MCTGESPGNGFGSIFATLSLCDLLWGCLALTFLLLSGSPSRISATICVWRVSWQQSTHILVQAACLTGPGLLAPLFRGWRESSDGLSPGLRWPFERALGGPRREGKGRTKDGRPAMTQQKEMQRFLGPLCTPRKPVGQQPSGSSWWLLFLRGLEPGMRLPTLW